MRLNSPSLLRARSLFVLMLLAAPVVLAACSGSGRVRYDTPREAYERGLASYEDGKHVRAIEFFQGVFNYGRTHEWADDAQLYLARAYAASGQHILAASEYQRFAQIYRTDPRVPDAEYERALSFYELSPRYQLDQTDTRAAIEEFQRFISKYPGDERAQDATERITELRNKLARKKVEAAETYERREIFSAAAVTYASAFDTYPDTEWADNALLGAIRSYVAYAEQSIESKQPERYEQAVAYYNRLVQLFPESGLIRDAEPFFVQARDALARFEAAEEATASSDS
jgi:outer membrane protein assembly factor BamD